MTKKYKILAEFAKDVSYETPDVETYLQTKDNILKYNLNLDINSKFLKNKIIEVNIISKFQETNLKEKKSNFEITYTAIVRIDENIKDEKEMKKIVLSDVPNEIYPRLEDLFITLVNKSGFPEVKIERKVDFEKLYKEKFN
jgi:preprotein translocase subunit SecB